MKIDFEKIQMDYGNIKEFCLKNGFKAPGNIYQIFRGKTYMWRSKTQAQGLREALFKGGYLIPENGKDKAYLRSMQWRLERRIPH